MPTVLPKKGCVRTTTPNPVTESVGGSGFRVPGAGSTVHPGFRVSGFGFQIPGFVFFGSWFRVRGFEFGGGTLGWWGCMYFWMTPYTPFG